MGTAPEIIGHIEAPPDLRGDTSLRDLERTLTANRLTAPLLQPHPKRARTYRLTLPSTAHAYSFAPGAGAASIGAYMRMHGDPSDLLVTFDRNTADEHTDDTILLTYGCPELDALLPCVPSAD